MADEVPAGSGDAPQITFNIKSSQDAKYTVTLPATATVLDLKKKLAGSDYADTPAERQRLIFSGRVLKDPDTLGGAKIKEGHTIHLVKSAASNARQNPASSSTTGSPAPASNVPTNIAAGTGNNPLAALTGARYAGFHGLPNAQSFGADGGMGPPVGPEEMERMLRNPNFLSQMNEMMDNPAFIEMMEQNPMLRDNPMARQMLRDPNYRRIFMNPEVMIQQLRSQRAQDTAAARSSFPSPGQTDNTETSGQTNTGSTGGTQGANASPFGPAGAGLFGGLNAGAAGGNPFAALFGPPPTSQTSTTPGDQPATTSSTDASNTTGTSNTTSTPPFNPLAALFGPQASGGDNNINQDTDQFAAFNRLMQNPDFLPAMQSMMNLGGGGAGAAGAPPGAGGIGGNPQAQADFLRSLGGMGGMGGDGGNPFSLFGGAQTPAAPADTRPPEERYADQLRQLNDMGFFEFERNVEALRRSGGSVQGAIEYLLSS